MRRTALLGITAVLLVAGTGVALTGSDSRPSDETNATAAIADLPQESRAGAGVALDAPAANEVAAVPKTEPRVVKTATLTLSVADAKVTSTADAVIALVGRFGGFVAATDRQTSEAQTGEAQAGQAQAAMLTLRVPVSRFDEAMGELRKLGKVTGEELRGNDVTGQLVDLDARLRSLRAQESALNALMAKATTIGETLQVAQATADVRTQIEQLAGQQQSLADQADFATITTEVLGPDGVIPAEPQPEPLLVRSMRDAVGATLAVVGGVIVVLGAVLPLALLAAVAAAGWRLTVRRRAGVLVSGS